MTVLSRIRDLRPRLVTAAIFFLVSAALTGCLGTEQDRGAPSVSFSIANDQTVDADSVIVQGAIVDPMGVARASYQLNGGAEQPIGVAAAKKAEFSFSTELVDGDNAIVVNAYDRAGNLGFATLRVRRAPDTQPPSLTLTSPSDGASLTVSSIPITGTATDNRRVQRVTVQVNGGAESSIANGTGASLVFNATVDGLRSGQNSVAVHAYDQTGNRATVTRTVNVVAQTPAPQPAPLPPPDAVAPTVSFTQPISGTTLTANSVTVTGAVSDNVGVTRASWRLNGGPEQPLSVAGTSASFSFTAGGLAIGANAIVVNAYDAAGNVGTAQVNVLVQAPTPPQDTAAPVVNLSAPADGATVNTASVTVQGSANDNVGVTRVALQLNGGAEQSATVAPGPTVTFSRSLSGLLSGTNVIVVNAYDAAGNKGSTSLRVTYSAPVDSVAPTITIATPVAGATVSTSSLSASGQATDNVAVTRVTSQVNGGAEVDVPIAGGASSPFSTTISGLVSGANTIRFNAYDAAGNRGSATVTVSYAPPAPGPTPSGVTFPLRVESGKRYLVDAAGKPFFINGDTAWSLMAQLTREQVEQYLEDRRTKGFTAILASLIEYYYADNAPRNAYGDAPFTTAGDFSTPNERYFAHVDFVLGKAAEKGMLVLLTPSYIGCCGDGWLQDMRNNGTAKLTRYGEYLGNRYRNFGNIVWVNGGDQSPTSAGDRALIDAIANGIRSVDGSKLQTFHTGRFSSAMQYTSAAWLTVNNIYTDASTVVSQALGEYARSTMPFFLIEGSYENEGASEHTVRLQAYQAVLSGAMGHVYGNNPVWNFNGRPIYATGQTWQQALNNPGARSMTHIASLFAARSWWNLAPDASNALLAGGIGTGADRAVAARAADGSFAIAYLPSIRTVTINLGQLTGPRVNARWYDPASGTYSTITGSPFNASGSQTFRPAANNSSGYGDWVLVLESTQ